MSKLDRAIPYAGSMLILLVIIVGALATHQHFKLKRYQVDELDITTSDRAAYPGNVRYIDTHRAGFYSEYTNTENEVVNYGANVYYFPFTKDEFGNKLVCFMLTHTNLEVSAMTGNTVRRYGKFNVNAHMDKMSTSDYGANIGYFVTFREKDQR